MPTIRGPARFIHKPPTNAAKPRVRIAMVKVSVTSEMLQWKAAMSGSRKTLQA